MTDEPEIPFAFGDMFGHRLTPEVLAGEPVRKTIRGGVFLVFNKYGMMPKAIHTTPGKADWEACRLARRFPGRTFLVLKATHKFRVGPSSDLPPSGEELAEAQAGPETPTPPQTLAALYLLAADWLEEVSNLPALRLHDMAGDAPDAFGPVSLVGGLHTAAELLRGRDPAFTPADQDDQFVDGTDFAHPAYWRGFDKAATVTAERILRYLDRDLEHIGGPLVTKDVERRLEDVRVAPHPSGQPWHKVAAEFARVALGNYQVAQRQEAALQQIQIAADLDDARTLAAEALAAEAPSAVQPAGADDR